MVIGAALAPTDPVLAADVQVGEPNTDADADHSTVEDEVRFSLTSEAGLNDGLAFPFVYLALAVAADGDRLTGSGFLHWLAIDLVGRVFVGVVAGICVGWVLSRVLFGHWRVRHERNTATSSGFVAIAATLIAYGTAEMLHGYGFLAVFVAAVTVRSVERSHEYVGVLHTFADEFEQLLVVALLVAFGGALVNGMLAGWDGWTLLLAAFCVFVARPVACRIALIGARPVAIERRAIEFFGIRGIGSLYYVAYAVTSADFVDADRIWAVVASTVVLSVVVHGALATPVMRRLDRVRARRRRGRPEPVGVGALGG